ncbi:hypothetical protein CBR_g16922 [Chara braunii]|uniref:DUF4378 domain-containing protein n=1 Tax=Chara braunii TaxID=69332 RepID=A0A388KU66_CHABU|nr:hypothetical protein CBR_g16922 [Chara braunii]|eukprot:GBG73579.1 hypothetical protein CBR_g16922 [Chara braunii]
MADITSEQWKVMLDSAAEDEKPFFQKLYEDAIHREREVVATAKATSIVEQMTLLEVPESNGDRFQKLAAAIAALVRLRTLENIESRVTALEQRNQELQAEIVSLKQSQLSAHRPLNPRPAAVPISHPNTVLLSRGSGTVTSAGTVASSSSGSVDSFALVLVPNAETSARNAPVLTGIQYSSLVVDKRAATLPSKYDGKDDITSWISSMRSFFEVLQTPREDRSMIMGSNTEPAVRSFIEFQAVTAGYEIIDLTEWLKVTPVRTLEDLLIAQYQDKHAALKARVKLEALKGQTLRTSMQALEQHLTGLFTTPNLGWTEVAGSNLRVDAGIVHRPRQLLASYFCSEEDKALAAMAPVVAESKRFVQCLEVVEVLKRSEGGLLTPSSPQNVVVVVKWRDGNGSPFAPSSPRNPVVKRRDSSPFALSRGNEDFNTQTPEEIIGIARSGSCNGKFNRSPDMYIPRIGGRGVSWPFDHKENQDGGGLIMTNGMVAEKRDNTVRIFKKTKLKGLEDLGEDWATFYSELDPVVGLLSRSAFQEVVWSREPSPNAVVAAGSLSDTKKTAASSPRGNHLQVLNNEPISYGGGGLDGSNKKRAFLLSPSPNERRISFNGTGGGFLHDRAGGAMAMGMVATMTKTCTVNNNTSPLRKENEGGIFPTTRVPRVLPACPFPYFDSPVRPAMVVSSEKSRSLDGPPMVGESQRGQTSPISYTCTSTSLDSFEKTKLTCCNPTTEVDLLPKKLGDSRPIKRLAEDAGVASETLETLPTVPASPVLPHGRFSAAAICQSLPQKSSFSPPPKEAQGVQDPSNENRKPITTLVPNLTAVDSTVKAPSSTELNAPSSCPFPPPLSSLAPVLPPAQMDPLVPSRESCLTSTSEICLASSLQLSDVENAAHPLHCTSSSSSSSSCQGGVVTYPIPPPPGLHLRKADAASPAVSPLSPLHIFPAVPQSAPFPIAKDSQTDAAPPPIPAARSSSCQRLAPDCPRSSHVISPVLPAPTPVNIAMSASTCSAIACMNERSGMLSKSTVVRTTRRKSPAPRGRTCPPAGAAATSGAGWLSHIAGTVSPPIRNASSSTSSRCSVRHASTASDGKGSLVIDSPPKADSQAGVKKPLLPRGRASSPNVVRAGARFMSPTASSSSRGKAMSTPGASSPRRNHGSRGEGEAAGSGTSSCSRDSMLSMGGAESGGTRARALTSLRTPESKSVSSSHPPSQRQTARTCCSSPTVVGNSREPQSERISPRPPGKNSPIAGPITGASSTGSTTVDVEPRTGHPAAAVATRPPRHIYPGSSGGKPAMESSAEFREALGSKDGGFKCRDASTSVSVTGQPKILSGAAGVRGAESSSRRKVSPLNMSLTGRGSVLPLANAELPIGGLPPPAESHASPASGKALVAPTAADDDSDKFPPSSCTGGKKENLFLVCNGQQQQLRANSQAEREASPTLSRAGRKKRQLQLMSSLAKMRGPAPVRSERERESSCMREGASAVAGGDDNPSAPQNGSVVSAGRASGAPPPPLPPARPPTPSKFMSIKGSVRCALGCFTPPGRAVVGAGSPRRTRTSAAAPASRAAQNTSLPPHCASSGLPLPAATAPMTIANSSVVSPSVGCINDALWHLPSRMTDSRGAGATVASDTLTRGNTTPRREMNRELQQSDAPSAPKPWATTPRSKPEDRSATPGRLAAGDQSCDQWEGEKAPITSGEGETVRGRAVESPTPFLSTSEVGRQRQEEHATSRKVPCVATTRRTGDKVIQCSVSVSISAVRVKSRGRASSPESLESTSNSTLLDLGPGGQSDRHQGDTGTASGNRSSRRSTSVKSMPPDSGITGDGKLPSPSTSCRPAYSKAREDPRPETAASPGVGDGQRRAKSYQTSSSGLMLTSSRRYSSPTSVAGDSGAKDVVSQSGSHTPSVLKTGRVGCRGSSGSRGGGGGGREVPVCNRFSMPSDLHAGVPIASAAMVRSLWPPSSPARRDSAARGRLTPAPARQPRCPSPLVDGWSARNPAGAQGRPASLPRSTKVLQGQRTDGGSSLRSRGEPEDPGKGGNDGPGGGAMSALCRGSNSASEEDRAYRRNSYEKGNKAPLTHRVQFSDCQASCGRGAAASKREGPAEGAVHANLVGWMGQVQVQELDHDNGHDRRRLSASRGTANELHREKGCVNEDQECTLLGKSRSQERIVENGGRGDKRAAVITRQLTRGGNPMTVLCCTEVRRSRIEKKLIGTLKEQKKVNETAGKTKARKVRGHLDCVMIVELAPSDLNGKATPTTIKKDETILDCDRVNGAGDRCAAAAAGAALSASTMAELAGSASKTEEDERVKNRESIKGTNEDEAGEGETAARKKSAGSSVPFLGPAEGDAMRLSCENQAGDAKLSVSLAVVPEHWQGRNHQPSEQQEDDSSTPGLQCSRRWDARYSTQEDDSSVSGPTTPDQVEHHQRRLYQASTASTCGRSDGESWSSECGRGKGGRGGGGGGGYGAGAAVSTAGLKKRLSLELMDGCGALPDEHPSPISALDFPNSSECSEPAGELENLEEIQEQLFAKIQNADWVRGKAAGEKAEPMGYSNDDRTPRGASEMRVAADEYDEPSSFPSPSAISEPLVNLAPTAVSLKQSFGGVAEPQYQDKLMRISGQADELSKARGLVCCSSKFSPTASSSFAQCDPFFDDDDALSQDGGTQGGATRRRRSSGTSTTLGEPTSTESVGARDDADAWFDIFSPESTAALRPVARATDFGPSPIPTCIPIPGDELIRCESQTAREDLVYVRDVIAASGFATEDERVRSKVKWYTPGQPLEPALFQQMERERGGTLGSEPGTLSCLEDTMAEPLAADRNSFFSLEDGHQNHEHGTSFPPTTPPAPPHPCLSSCDPLGAVMTRKERRWLLFNAVSEGLARKLAPEEDGIRKWLGTSSTCKQLKRQPSGKELVKEVWAMLRGWSEHARRQGATMDSMLSRDLSSQQWLQKFHKEYEEIGQDLETSVFDRLLAELLDDLGGVEKGRREKRLGPNLV